MGDDKNQIMFLALSLIIIQFVLILKLKTQKWFYFERKFCMLYMLYTDTTHVGVISS